MPMTLTSKKGKIEVFYDSNADKDSVQLTVPDKNGVLQVVQVELNNIVDLEDAVLEFEKLFIKVARKEAMLM